jgi:hypothetical protein
MSICNLLKNKIKINLEVNPYIDVYIYNILTIKHNEQENFFLYAKKKFNNLYIDNNKKGIIYPTKYVYKNININFSKNNIYDNKRIYTSDILTSEKKIK